MCVPARVCVAVLTTCAAGCGRYIGTLIIALALPQLEVVFGLTGATSAVLVSYILPAAFYLRLRPSAVSWRNSWRQLLLIGFGVVAGIAGTAEIVSSMAAS